MNHPSSTPPPCSCHKPVAPGDSVPRAAFEAMRRQVNELAEIVGELAKSQPGADAPLPASAKRSRGVSALTSAAALAARAARIVGGVKVSPGEFPHCVVIGNRFNNGGFPVMNWFCTGVLIHPRVILTAAHCMPNSPNVVALHAEDINRLQTPGVEVIGVLKSFSHPGYVPSATIPMHDIALLILETAATTPHVDAASAEELAAAGRVTLVGFGNDDVHSTRGFGVKRKVTVDLKAVRRSLADDLDHEEARYGFESDNEFVAGNPVMDSCNGDSGGPAYIESGGRFLVAGLTSRGIREEPDDDTPCGDGGIYTRVDAHWEWIRQTAGRYLV